MSALGKAEWSEGAAGDRANGAIPKAVAAADGSPPILHKTIKPQNSLMPGTLPAEGGDWVVQWEQWMEIKDLKSQGHSIRSIARLTGHSRNTVRKVLGQKKPEPFRSPEKASKLDDFKDYAGKRYQECALRLCGFWKRSGRWDTPDRFKLCAVICNHFAPAGRH